MALGTEPQTLEGGAFPSTAELFGRIRRGQGVDLEAYRAEAIGPQLKQRMQALGLQSLSEYLAHTARDARELTRLLDALLIGSTAFFRDPPAFSALHDRLVQSPALGQEGSPLRAWVAGCSSGEEAYSLAMLMFEALELRGSARGVRVYATDLRQSCLKKARQGLYTHAALKGVSQDRLARFFSPDKGGYRVTRRLRDAVVFGQHDLIRDPPFSKLDVISCRNVLLYLEETAQQRLLERFHFGLKPEGILFLGPAESTAAAPRSFRALDRAHRLYGKNAHTQLGGP